MSEDDGHAFDFEQMTFFANRREALSKKTKNCPECTKDQVQLLAYHSQPAQWKCRICKHRFNWEPEGCWG